jgi:hypothetical protein
MHIFVLTRMFFRFNTVIYVYFLIVLSTVFGVLMEKKVYGVICNVPKIIVNNIDKI